MTPSERYSQAIVEGMRLHGLVAIAERGTHQALRFVVKVGRHRLVRDIDFRVAVTAEDRTRILHWHYRALLKEALDLDAVELLKVAHCPTCREWFPTFGERNDHRKKCREDAQIEVS